MGIYFVTDCFSGNTYEVDFGSFEVNPLEVWSFSGVGGTLYCGTINEGEQPTVSEYTGITQYTDCYDCFTGSGISVLMEECNSLFGYYQNPSFFTSIPNIGDVYKFCSPFESADCYCFKVLGFAFGESIDPIYAGGPFTDCFTCQNPPTSAGTEVFLCEQICTESGTTVVSVVAPHPVWTNGYGGEVTQLNMITLGGNGLNS